MRNKLLLGFASLIFVFGTNISIAQNSSQKIAPSLNGFCATEAPGQEWEQQFQKLVTELKANQQYSKVQSQVFTIPVIIHVVHGGQAVGTYPNLAQGQLVSQIQALNDDFGGIGYNRGNYPATAFMNYADSASLPSANRDGIGRVAIANCNIQFCLATKDTLGNPLAEPGIDRVNYIAKGWSNPAGFTTITTLKNFVDGTVKPQTVWNVSKYMNIWITDNNVNANSLLGYATFPKLSTLNGIPSGSTGSNLTDGFWCYSRVFGSKTFYPAGTYYSGYDRGRTSTHEIGHYLGLRHIGGDGNSNPSGDCTATDYCDDTPPQRGGFSSGQYGQNFGAPGYPLYATGANACPTAFNGCMFMNFMDYTDDNTKYMYTTDQATRIQTAMLNCPYRKLLGTHNLCSVNNVAAVSLFNIPNTVCQSAIVTPTNNSTGTPVPNYTWTASGGALFSPNANSPATSIYFPSSGTFVISLATNNGTQSSVSKTITVNPSPNLVFTTSSPTTCVDAPVTVTATGGTSYIWQPGNVAGNILSYNASVNQTYICTAVGVGGCKKIDSLTLYVSDCLGIGQLRANLQSVKVYPNPVQDLLILSNVSGQFHSALCEVMDPSGKVVIRQTISFMNENREAQVSTALMANGLYFVKVSFEDGNSQTLKLIK